MHRVSFHFGWIVVGITCVVLALAAGVRSAPGVLIQPLGADLGWSRAVLSFAASLGLLLLGLTSPVAGWLNDRFGPRLVVALGLTIVAVSLLAGAVMTEVWQLNLFWGVLSGSGTGLAAGVLGATVANRWFVARRGLVLGIFSAATSAGQLLLIPALMTLVVALGWRNATAGLGLLVVLALPLVLLLLRNDPAELGLRPYGAADDQPQAVANVARLSPATLLRTPAFWLVAGSFATCGVTAPGLISTHFVAHSIDRHIPEAAAAGTLAIIGVMNFVGTLGAGWLTDRIDPRRLLAVVYVCRGLSLVLLPFVGDISGLVVFAIIFGLDYGATVPPTAALVADHFGRRNVGVVFGWVFLIHQIGAALAAYLGGLVQGLLGDYGLAFLVGGLVAIMGGLLALYSTRLSPRPAAAPALALPAAQVGERQAA